MDKNKVKNINDYRYSYEEEIICLKCYNRWIETFTVSHQLKDVECKFCGETGFIILTGQPLTFEYE